MTDVKNGKENKQMFCNLPTKNQKKNCWISTNMTKNKKDILTCIVRVDIIVLTIKTAGHLGCYCKAGKTKFYGSVGGLIDRVWFFCCAECENLSKK